MSSDSSSVSRLLLPLLAGKPVSGIIVPTKGSSIFPNERDQMTDLGAVLAQLKVDRAKLDRAIAALSGVVEGDASKAGRGKRSLSVAARKRIAAAQRARWAKFKAKKAT